MIFQAARRFLNTAQCYPHPILAENQPLLQVKSALIACSMRKSRAAVYRLYSSAKGKRFQVKYSGSCPHFYSPTNRAFPRTAKTKRFGFESVQKQGADGRHFIGICVIYTLRFSFCLRARSRAGCIFISLNSPMAKSRCSSASAFFSG